jgi:SAM-dependent methyltransferase
MIEFPLLPDGKQARWVGPGFEIGGRHAEVLEYSSDASGWDDELTAMHEAEAADGHHSIDLMSRRAALARLRQSGFPEDGVLLEIGCSSGFLMSQLREAYPRATLIGVDVVSGPLVRLAKTIPNAAFVRMNMAQCIFSDELFDGIVALNVLEHIADDERAVRHIYRVLKPGGVFVVEVPQGPGLFDGYDRALRHFRRYSPASLRKLLSKAGFRIEFHSHLGFSIYPAFALAKLIGRYRPGSVSAERMRTERQIRGSRGSRLLKLALRLDELLERVASLPIGIRCVATARKPRSA